ncbi:hypothetical protein PybrP1_003273 [[Pythium] brassicae (nom. inval.)]|nr:hypothetical protein PybrP1_003273 [[Pythium] brassicae (nom. inval.)]
MHLLLRLHNKFPDDRAATPDSNGGGEFVNGDLWGLCADRGIAASITNVYSPHENSIVERAHRALVTSVRAMLAATELPSSLWDETLLHAVLVVTTNVTVTLSAWY